MKIGFFGGSFNPPTNAHISLAKKALEVCKLDKVIFVPMGDSYEKKDLAKAKDRYNMLEIVCTKETKLEVSDLEIKENRKMHAIDAFRLIDRVYSNSENYFIIGADNFINLSNWKDSEELIGRYKYIVLEREDIDIRKYIEENVKEQVKGIFIVKNEEHKNISSSLFRDMKSKENVPKEVFDYIMENHIY